MGWPKVIALSWLLVGLGPGVLLAQERSERPGCREGYEQDQDGCPCRCPKIYQPVCGVDGVTYPNDCFACPIAIQYQGVCGAPGHDPSFHQGGDPGEGDAQGPQWSTEVPADEPIAGPSPDPSCFSEGVGTSLCTPLLPVPERSDLSEQSSACPAATAPRVRLWDRATDWRSVDRSFSPTLADWIADSPGVALVRHGRASGAWSLRGLGGRRNLLVWDGIPLNGSSLVEGLSPTWGPVSLFALSGVEVHRGPLAGRFGSDALGGAVVVTSAIPTLVTDGFDGSVEARFASAELERTGAVRAEGRVGPFALLGGVSAQQTSELVAGDPLGEQDRPGYTQLAGHAVAGLETSLGTFWGRYAASRQLGIEEPVSTWPDSSSTVRGRALDFAWIGFHREDWHSRLAQSDLRLAYLRRQRETQQADGRQGVGTVHQVSLRGSSLTPIGRSVRVKWGAEFDLYRLVLSGVQPDHPEAADLVDGSGRFDLAGLANAELAVTHQLVLELQARVAWTRLRVPTVGERPGLVMWELPVNGGVAARYLLTPALSFHVGASTSSRSPDLNDLYATERRADGTVLANADLSGERLLGLDAGVSLQFERFRVELMGFHGFLFDLISLLPTGELDPANLDSGGAPLPFLRQINLGEALVSGLEAEAEVKLAAMVLYGWLSWVRGEDVTGDQPLRGIPPLTGRFGIAYRSDRWGAGPRCHFALKQDRTAIGEAATPGYAIFGLTGYLQFADWGRVAVSVDNLAGQGYRTHGSSFPEPGFNAAINIQAELP
ncbi:MAG: TonB-dependent receptor [Bradymonadales bacterium]|nr:TonB-dependent receptor [Bradymonadales bacterium]